MQPLDALTPEEAHRLRGLLFDLDDTLLDGTLLTEAAYSTLWRLHRAGLRLVAVTGRPAGFGEVIARQWPIDGVVTENGAVAFYREGKSLRRIEEADEATRRARRIRLASVYESLRESFPDARLAADVHLRQSDLALDVGESQEVSPELRKAIAKKARELGVRTSLSSIHLHLTLDAHDKASGAIAFLRELFDEDSTSARAAYAFVGDSGNDAPCFAAFRTTFGVANVRASLGSLAVTPRYVASKPRGEGFAEIANRIVELRVLWGSTPPC